MDRCRKIEDDESEDLAAAVVAERTTDGGKGDRELEWEDLLEGQSITVGHQVGVVASNRSAVDSDLHRGEESCSSGERNGDPRKGNH
jgi:hypothetical protein